MLHRRGRVRSCYYIIIKSANMDKGGGVNAYPQNVDKKSFFFTPSLIKYRF